MIRLYVNVDHVATIREARKVDEPDPLTAALMAELAGADGITIHLREDRRHIQDHDVARIRHSIKTPMNLEMALTDEMVSIALKIKPYQVSLVPENRMEVTTEGGFNVAEKMTKLPVIREKFKEAGIMCSLFIDPDSKQIEAAHRIGVDSVEINTGPYTEIKGRKEIQLELVKIEEAAKYASKLGIRVYAGHGLTIKNVISISAISEIEELNIGHSIVARSIYLGMEKAVREMRSAIEQGIRLRKN